MAFIVKKIGEEQYSLDDGEEILIALAQFLASLVHEEKELREDPVAKMGDPKDNKRDGPEQ